VWNERDPNGYTFAGGDTVNWFDHDGRMSKADYQNASWSQQYDQWSDANNSKNYTIGEFFDENSAFRNALQSSGAAWGELSYGDRMAALDMVVGAPWEASVGYTPSGSSTSAGADVANILLNTDARQEAADDWNNADWNSGWGVTMKVASGISYAANTVDAAANMIPIVGTGKALLEDSGKAGIKAVAKMFEKDAAEGGAFNAIGSTGKVGEQWLARNLGGESQVFFNTSQGARYVDQLAGGIANESKVGYQSLTPSIQLQISKDAELLNTRAVQGVDWHFFQSPVTGLGGPSQPLFNALQQNGINFIIH
jgi:hypothetical protein